MQTSLSGRKEPQTIDYYFLLLIRHELVLPLKYGSLEQLEWYGCAFTSAIYTNIVGDTIALCPLHNTNGNESFVQQSFEAYQVTACDRATVRKTESSLRFGSEVIYFKSQLLPAIGDQLLGSFSLRNLLLILTGYFILNLVALLHLITQIK
jgi:hypothetical protein